MHKHWLQILVPMTVIVLLALFVAFILFRVLSSEGQFDIGTYGQFGGAAAGFFATFLGLKSWYDKLDERQRVKDDESLIRSVASFIATGLVSSSKGDPVALTTDFLDLQPYLLQQFAWLGDEWVEQFLEQLKAETILVARAYPTLNRWTPPAISAATVEDVEDQ